MCDILTAYFVFKEDFLLSLSNSFKILVFFLHCTIFIEHLILTLGWMLEKWW